MPTNTGVFPVHDNVFKIGKNGKTSSTSDMVPIAEMETFSPSIDGNVEEWTPMDTNGWKKRMKTGASMAISFTGKRCIGDEGNDYVATTAWKIGKDCESKFEWDFPDGRDVYKRQGISCGMQAGSLRTSKSFQSWMAYMI